MNAGTLQPGNVLFDVSTSACSMSTLPRDQNAISHLTPGAADDLPRDSGLAPFSVCDWRVAPFSRLFRFTEDRLAASDAHGNVMAYELTDTSDEIVTEQLFSLRLGSLTGAQHVFCGMHVYSLGSALCAPGLQIRYKLGLLYCSSCVTSSRRKL